MNRGLKLALAGLLVGATVSSYAISLTNASPAWFFSNVESSSASLTGGGFFNAGASSNFSTSAYQRLWFAAAVGSDQERPVGTSGSDFASGSGNTITAFMSLGTGNVNNFTFEKKYYLLAISPTQAVVKIAWKFKDNRATKTPLSVKLFPYADLASQGAGDVADDAITGSVSTGASTGFFQVTTPSNSSRPTIYYKSYGRTIDGFEGSASTISGTSATRVKMTNTGFDGLTNAIASGTNDVSAAFQFNTDFGSGTDEYTGVIALGYNINPSEDGIVTGTVDLADISSEAGKSVVVELRNPGSLTAFQTATVTLGAGGTFSVNTTHVGLCDVAIKGSHWGRKVVANVNVSPVGAVVSATLPINGDANNDNAVDLLDYFDLSDSYNLSLGDSGFNAECDFNDDTSVDLLDYFILSDNYNLNGQD